MMKAILLTIAIVRSGNMRFVQNVANTRLAAKYPTSAVRVIAQSLSFGIVRMQLAC